MVALASRAVLRGFGVGSTVSHADDASLAPRERGTATLKTGGSGGRSHGELESRCTPAAAMPPPGPRKPRRANGLLYRSLVLAPPAGRVVCDVASRRREARVEAECAPCRAALLTVTNRDSTMMDEAEQALGLKASKD